MFDFQLFALIYVLELNKKFSNIFQLPVFTYILEK